ncbi:hypothetical protein EDB81DRAFT_948038 [Dactylonectria macrodidyma]|uniref:Uncharacterized protein n=1 Tax=Dactylonectria macrodidyma TaxID=307937 RepID=A0A9P9EU70_9HYPO|nr:hypothetical protein EDB81DRAFT_948038 [Dactylonectria macrodidyma]
MEGSGYNDQAKLKAALELAQSFKKGGSAKEAPHRSKGGSSSGGSRPQPDRQDQVTPHYSNQGKGRQEQQQGRSERPPLSVPPPSQRSYTTTLASDISKIGPGPILGTKAADFLGRQDNYPKREVSSNSEATRKDTMPNSTKADTKKAPLNFAAAEGFLRLCQSAETKTPVPVMAREDTAPIVVKLPTSSAAPVLAKQEGWQPIVGTTNLVAPVLNKPRGSQPLADTTNTTKQATKDDVVDSFFSLMDQDSAEVKKQFQVPPAAFWLLANDQPSVVVATQPIHQPKEPNQGHTPSKIGHDDNPSSSQIRTEGKGKDEPEKKNLQPKVTKSMQKDISQGDTPSELGHDANRSSSSQIQTEGNGGGTEPQKKNLQPKVSKLIQKDISQGHTTSEVGHDANCTSSTQIPNGVKGGGPGPQKENLPPKVTEFIQKGISRGHTTSEVGYGADRPSSIRIHPGEKGSGTELQKETLRPKTAEFIQKNTSSKNTDEGTTSPAIRCVDSKLSPAAQEWAPTPDSEIDVQFSNLQLHDCIVPTGQSTGHLVSITPVQFTDGRIVPGISTGQLYLQTPVNVNQGTNPQVMSRPTTPNLPAFGNPLGVSYGLPTPLTPTPVTPTPNKSTTAKRKPTQGLKASMWATK